mgnify:FL=1
MKSKDGQELVNGMDDGKMKGYTTVMERLRKVDGALILHILHVIPESLYIKKFHTKK